MKENLSIKINYRRNIKVAKVKFDEKGGEKQMTKFVLQLGERHLKNYNKKVGISCYTKNTTLLCLFLLAEKKA